jgi:actin-related protein
VVLDSGDGVSHAVPVYQGFTVPNSIRRIDVAGRDVTEYLQTLLRKSGYVFHTSAEKEVVRLIKESVTYIAKDPRKEEKEWAAAKLDPGRIAEYVLPDGNKLKVRTVLHTCPRRRQLQALGQERPMETLTFSNYRSAPNASAPPRSSSTRRS